MDWGEGMETDLDRVEIILLLVSPDFIVSDYAYSIEMRLALERHETGAARLIPIILRPADWKREPFGKLSVLPRDGKPVTTWPNRDEAFSNVAQVIRTVVEEFTKKPFINPSSP